MKIALVIYQFSDTKGGVERFCAEFARGLIRRGHDVHLVLHKAGGGVPPEAMVHMVPVRKWTSAMKHLSFAAAAERFLRSQSFDLIQTFSRTTFQDIYRVGGGSHRSYLRSLEGGADGWWQRLRWWLSPHDRAILRLERMGFRPGAYRKIVCVSHRCRADILADFRLPAEDVEVIHNGVDLNRFTPVHRDHLRKETRARFGVPESETIFLFAGSGFRRKGLRRAIEGLTTIPERDRPLLWVVGHGNPARYQKIAQKLRLKGRLFFLGARDDIQSFYAASDAFLFPTLYDPFPNACLEALASGLPVILSRNAGVAEIMTDGEDGVLLDDPRSAEAVGAAIRRLLDPAVRERMSAAARRTAEKHSIDACVDQYLELYRKVLDKKKAIGNRQ